MDEVDFPFHNHTALPEPNWAWDPDVFYPEQSPSRPSLTSTTRTWSPGTLGQVCVKEESDMT